MQHGEPSIEDPRSTTDLTNDKPGLATMPEDSVPEAIKLRGKKEPSKAKDSQ